MGEGFFKDEKCGNLNTMKKVNGSNSVSEKTLIEALDHVIIVMKDENNELRKEMRDGFSRLEAKDTELSRKIDDLRQDLGVVERKVLN